jgi:hypothetical protein
MLKWFKKNVAVIGGFLLAAIAAMFAIQRKRLATAQDDAAIAGARAKVGVNDGRRIEIEARLQDSVEDSKRVDAKRVETDAELKRVEPSVQTLSNEELEQQFSDWKRGV